MVGFFHLKVALNIPHLLCFFPLFLKASVTLLLVNLFTFAFSDHGSISEFQLALTHHLFPF